MTDVRNQTPKQSKSDLQLQLVVSDRIIQRIFETAERRNLTLRQPTTNVSNEQVEKRVRSAQTRNFVAGMTGFVGGMGIVLTGLLVTDHTQADLNNEAGLIAPLGGFVAGVGIATVLGDPIGRAKTAHARRWLRLVDSAADKILVKRNLPQMDDVSAWYHLEQRELETLNEDMQQQRTDAVVGLSTDPRMPMGYSEAYAEASDAIWANTWYESSSQSLGI